MTQHFTRNTVSAEHWCGKCGKFTQHRIDNRLLGPCLDCIARLDKQHAAKAPVAIQEDLFHGVR